MLQFDWSNGVLDVPAKLAVAITHTVRAVHCSRLRFA
jgi:hypothetical protein